MQVTTRKMRNSNAVRVPKSILRRRGLEVATERPIRDGVVASRAVRRDPREGWAGDARRLALRFDVLVWPELGNEDDEYLIG